MGVLVSPDCYHRLVQSLLTCQGISWFLKSIFQILYTIDTVIHFDDNNWKISILKNAIFLSLHYMRQLLKQWSPDGYYCVQLQRTATVNSLILDSYCELTDLKLQFYPAVCLTEPDELVALLAILTHVETINIVKWKIVECHVDTPTSCEEWNVCNSASSLHWPTSQDIVRALYRQI